MKKSETMTENKAYEMSDISETQEQFYAEEENMKLSKRKLTKPNSRWMITRVIIPFSVWTIIFQVIPKLSAQFIEPDEWFFNLNFSPVKPPSIVVRSVWPFLYFTLSTYAWCISYELKRRKYQIAFVMFMFQMILNWLYGPVMFAWHSPEGILVNDIICVVVILSLIIFQFVDKKKWQLGVLLFPILLWECYATYLTGYIVANN